MSYVKLEATRVGNPVDVLQLVEANFSDLPVPADDELILQNLATPIHPSVLLSIQNPLSESQKFPYIPGNDVVSRVYKKGSKVTKYEVGQRVIPGVMSGSFTEYMVIKESQIIATVPDEVDDFTASQFFINGMTAYQLVNGVVKLGKDQWALQTAAASVLGRIAIQICKAKGFNLINIVRREAQVKELKSLGATHVLVYREDNQENLLKEIKSITDGKGVTYAFDAVGGKIGSFALKTVGHHGTFASYGVLSGEPFEVNPVDMIMKEIIIRSFVIFSWFNQTEEEKRRRDSEDLMNMIKEKKVIIKYDEVFEYKDYKKAFEEAMRGRKVIMVPSKK